MCQDKAQKKKKQVMSDKQQHLAWDQLVEQHNEPHEFVGSLVMFIMCKEAGFFTGAIKDNGNDSVKYISRILAATDLSRDVASMVASYLPAHFDSNKEQSCQPLLESFSPYAVNQQGLNLLPSSVELIHELFTREGVVSTTILLFENNKIKRTGKKFIGTFLSFFCLLVLHLYGREGLEYCLSIANAQFGKTTHTLCISQALSLSAEAQSKYCWARCCTRVIHTTSCSCHKIRRWWLDNCPWLFEGIRGTTMCMPYAPSH